MRKGKKKKKMVDLSGKVDRQHYAEAVEGGSKVVAQDFERGSKNLGPTPAQFKGLHHPTGEKTKDEEGGVIGLFFPHSAGRGKK